jgi:hypothetical protein
MTLRARTVDLYLPFSMWSVSIVCQRVQILFRADAGTPWPDLSSGR